MYGFFGLIIIAIGASFSVIWLLHYVPLKSTLFRIPYSPRLFVCKLLAPFDAVITLLLVMGTWVGITTTVTGISSIIYNILSGIGISLGVVLTKKFLVPKWEEQYEQEKRLC